MPRKKSSAKPKAVLVGTYRKPQLEKWVLPRGLYNFPVSDADAAIRAAAPTVSELWLYAGKSDKRRFSATFEREVSLADLVALGYPRGKGKPHAERYLLFRAEPLPAGAPQEAPPRVFLRLRDFVRSAKVLARLRRQFGDRTTTAPSAQPVAHPATQKPATDVSYLDDLPEDLLEDWQGNLFVCEEAEAFNLWGGNDCPLPVFPTVETRFQHEDDRFREIAVRASREAVSKSFAAGLPVTFWKKGRLYHRFPDGREAPVSQSEILQVVGGVLS